MQFVTLNDDGTIDLALIGRTAKLRRPKIGEIRQLRMQLETDAAKPAEDQDWITAETLRLSALSIDERVQAADALAVLREKTTAVREANERLRVEWIIAITKALDMVGREAVEDEIPGEALRGRWPGEIIQHWLGETPLALGDGEQ